MGTLLIENLIKKYGSTEIVHGINASIQDGEFIALVGPSGCGKSTVLRMIAGLEEITGGNLKINDQLMNGLAPKDRNIAMVFQNYALYPHMNVFDNMSFSLRLSHTPKNVINDKVNSAANILGLEKLLQRKPSELSGGQRQRVAMGRAIVREPEVFLFDEPLSNLDAKLRIQMRLEIKKLHHQLKTTVVYVTHDQVEAMTLADRIIIMRDGIIEQIGKPLELYHYPANTFVAGFIGTPPMNLLNGNLIKDGENYAVKIGDHLTIPVVGAERFDLQNITNVVVGVRPEQIEIGEKETDDDFTTTAFVDVSEPLGNEVIVHFNIDGNALVASVKSDHTFQNGDKITIKFNPASIHIFDANTKKKLNAR